MTELLTAAQMRQIEQDAIASGAVTGLELMERAGQGVVDAVFEEWPELAKTTHRAVVLCGPGNNGGDGFVIARLLKQWGWEVEVFLYGDAETLPPDAKVNCERWRALGKVQDWSHDALDHLRNIDLLVDAVFGTGLKRPIPDQISQAFGLLRGQVRKPYIKRYRRCVAVDFPSGIHSDTGQMLGHQQGHWLQAQLCVTFSFQKLGHHLSDGPFHCKKLVTRPLGLRRERFLERGLFNEPEDDRRVSLLDNKLFGRKTPFMKGTLGKHHGWNKYDIGHAFVLSGGIGRGGAARMAARGALRIGAGVVTVGCPPAALIENAAQLNAIMLQGVKDADALADRLEDERISALCIGPALGMGKREAALVETALRAKHKPHVVLDADALTLLARDQSLFNLLHDGCVLTPHGGEFARLFPDIADKLNALAAKGPAYSKVDATREAAARAGCVVLFKGPDTVIAAPDGRCSINSAHYAREAPWLATAGAGDVLAGFITGLLARGYFEPMQAAEVAAWLHVECARSFGPGLIAEDLPEELPKVFRQIGL